MTRTPGPGGPSGFSRGRTAVEAAVERRRHGFLGSCAERATAMEAVARAIVLASQAFTAGIPLVIVASALAPRDRDFATRLVRRFHLHGSTADQVRSLFISDREVRGAITWFGVLFLFASAMSFAGSMQVVYERAFDLAHLGWRARGRAALWLLAVVLYFGVFLGLKANISEGGTNVLRAALSVPPSFLFWLATPRILLGPRISWRRVIPVAWTTTISVTILTLATPLYMPDLVGSSAERFGTIGGAFALLSWLTALAFLIVGSAVVASQLDHSSRPRNSGRDEVLHES